MKPPRSAPQLWMVASRHTRLQDSEQAMKRLSVTLALFGILALVQPARQLDLQGALLGSVVLLCAATTFRSTAISSFLKIFVGIFSTETIVFGIAVLAGRAGLWPADYAEYLPPESLPLTVAIFSILVYLVAQSGMVRQIMRIADRYFNAEEAGRARVWPFRPFTSLERRIGVAMVVFLVLINQAQVGIIVRLNFFNRDLFNAIQNHDAVTFWHQLLFVFTPFAFLYVATTVIEFFTQSMLVIRWRRWLTDHFVSRWLAHHNHYRISLVAGQTDNPDQRIAEDVYRFINGGSDGSSTAYGIYDFSILLISTVSSLVSFAIVLWGLSRSFTLPGTDIILPGFLFWVALLYAGLGTLITHLIGRPLRFTFLRAAELWWCRQSLIFQSARFAPRSLIRRCPVPIRTTTFAERFSMPISATSSTNSIAKKCGHSGCPVGSSSALR